MKKGKQTWVLLARIIHLLKPNKKKLFFVSLGLLVTTLAGFFQPLILKVITDDGLVNKNLSVLIASTLLLLGVVLISQLVETLLSSLFADIHNQSEYRVYFQSFHKLLKLKHTYFTDKNSAEVINAMAGDAGTVSSLVDSYSVMLISFIFKIISGLAGLLIISPVLTIVVLAMVPIKFFTVKKLAKIKEKRTKLYIQNFSEFDAWLSDTISGIKEIKLWNSYRIKENKFKEMKEGLLKDNKDFTMIDAWNSFVEISLEWIVTISLYICGGLLLLNGNITLGALFAFLSYSGSVTAPIAAVFNFQMIIARVMPSAKRLFKFLDLEEEPCGAIQDVEIGDIVFNNVSFAYNSDRTILDKTSFSIPQGAKVAIIGANGSGKSTIIDLILKFLEPKSGTITINNTSIEDIDIGQYRELFSVVSQDPFLFKGTIKENIDLQGTQNLKQLTYVFQKSGVAAYLGKMPNGENSILGNNGARLSGGEKQKLAVARALMKDTPFVILDEATSGFDVESDAYLHDVIINEMDEKTVLLITHRYENLDGMDIVLKLENGRIEKIK